MKLLKKPIAIILLLLFVLSVAGTSFASAVDRKLAEADKAVATARQTASSTERDKHYKSAIDTYEEVRKKNPGTPEAAIALYRLAEVKSREQDDRKAYYRSLYEAHEHLKLLINTYDKSARDLRERGFTPAEVQSVQQLVQNAHTKDAQIRAELDEHKRTEGYSAVLYRMMDFLVNLTGKVPSFSYWFAIALLTVIIKIITMPLTKAQFKAMKEMQLVAPKVKELQEKYKGDQKAIGEKTMELYKEHNINPFASCLPILIQMPILMVLWYTMKAYEFQFLEASFLWIGSGLSHMAQITVPLMGGTVWLTAGNLAEPDLILLVLYLISMYISTRLSAVDPSQAEQQRMMAIMMPLMFGFIFATFPSAFLLYWLLLNILQTIQQYFILRAPAPALATGTPITEPSAPAPEPGTPPANTPKPDGGRINRRRRRK